MNVAELSDDWRELAARAAEVRANFGFLHFRFKNDLRLGHRHDAAAYGRPKSAREPLAQARLLRDYIALSHRVARASLQIGGDIAPLEVQGRSRVQGQQPAWRLVCADDIDRIHTISNGH